MEKLTLPEPATAKYEKTGTLYDGDNPAPKDKVPFPNKYFLEREGRPDIRSMTADRQWDRANARRRNEDDPPANTGLLPAERFPDHYEPEDPNSPDERGAVSTVIQGLIAGACAGWKRQPNAEEFYNAMRATEPTDRQITLAGVLIAEGSCNDVLLAYLQGAFTWRQLARMMHRRRLYSGELARFVNVRAKPQ